MRKKLFGDVFINLVAASLCTASLNLVVYPLYAKKFTDVEYGNILTIIGAINLLWAVFGNCLNNTRLILNRNPRCRNEDGNYNVYITISSMLSGVVIIFVIALFPMRSFISILLAVLTVIFGVARAYYVVSFRLKLDYYTQLKTNAIVSAGYIVGILLTNTLDFWPLALLLGEATAFFYTIQNGSLIGEPFRLTNDKSLILRTYLDLIFTGLIGNIIAYFDRFLINPLIGPASVAVFTVASFWGKAVTPFISPTANVMLSYLSQKNTTISMRRFITVFAVSVVPLVIFGLIGLLIAPWITGILYPSLIEQAEPYIFIASMGTLIQCSTNLLMPLLLSVCSSRTILQMQTIYFIFYLILAFVGAKTGGLMGFCIATCIVGIIKVVIFFLFGYIAMKKATNY